jgi:hypothetical protein
MYTPRTVLESVVLESGRIELAEDSAGRPVLVVGHRRLAPVVLDRGLPALSGLVGVLTEAGGGAFCATEDDPWRIEPDQGGTEAVAAADEVLVMALHPLQVGGRPLRVAAGRDLARLLLLPWCFAAQAVDFGAGGRYVVTATRALVGEWRPEADARRGVVLGVPEAWAGVLDRPGDDQGRLGFRCDVPVPWMAESAVAGDVPRRVGVFGAEGAFVARLPVVLTEGSVVEPVTVPDGVDVGPAPSGLFDGEGAGAAEFALDAPH